MFHAGFVRGLADDPSKLRIAGILVRHVPDEVRQLVARVDTLERRRAVDVDLGIDEPVHVEDDDRVHAQRAAAPADLDVPVDRGPAAALVRPVELRQVHRGDVGDLGGEC